MLLCFTRVSIGVSVRSSSVRRGFCHMSSRNQKPSNHCLYYIGPSTYRVLHPLWHKCTSWFRVGTQEAIPRSAVVADQYPSVRFVRRSSSLVDIGVDGREIESFEIASHWSYHWPSMPRTYCCLCHMPLHADISYASEPYFIHTISR
jgi:hypothetical protein